MKRLTEEELDERSETSSASNEIFHHIKEIKEKQTLSVSEEKREKKSLLKPDQITDNNNAVGQKHSKINRNTQNHKQIPGCEQHYSAQAS